jgi:hypothetical protein
MILKMKSRNLIPALFVILFTAALPAAEKLIDSPKFTGPVDFSGATNKSTIRADIGLPTPSAAAAVVYVSKSAVATDVRTGLLATDPAKPFATLSAAKVAATAGTTIEVGPGVWNERDLLKNGVNWFFHPSAIVNCSSNSNGGIFDDSATTGANGPVTCTIGGFGKFVFSGTATSGLATGNVLRITNAASRVVIHCEALEAENAALYTYNCPVFHSGGRLSIFCDRLAGNVGAIWWEGGDLYVRANEAVARAELYWTFYAISGSGTDGKAWLDIQYIHSTHATSGALGFSGTAAEMQVWVTAKEIRGVKHGVFIEPSLTAGRLYINAQKMWITGTAQSDDDSGCGIFCGGSALEIWATIQKTNGRVLGLENGGALFLDILHVQDTTGETHPLFYLAFAPSAFIRVGEFRAETASGFLLQDTALRLTAGLLDFSSVSGSQPIRIVGSANGSSLRLCQGTVIKAHSATTNGITAADPQDVRNFGYFTNKAKHANITLKVIPTESVSADVE